MRAVLLGLLLALVAALPARAQTIDLGEPMFCLEPVPAALTPPPFSDPIDVRVLVLLDGVPEAVADAALQSAATAYTSLAMRVTAVEFRHVQLTKTDASELIAESRTAVGGVRPAGTDLVYTFTAKDMSGGAAGSAVAGMADCIGGVAFPDSAFAVGEADSSQDLIAAHELGHLFGAHHHYANCAEDICTLMINDVGLANMTFSSLNGSVVRGHAEAYLPAEPSPQPPSEPPPASSEEPQDPQPAPQDPQPAPQDPQPAPAQPAPTPHDAGHEHADRECRAARAAHARARKAVTAARKALRRRATRPRRRALRRAVGKRQRTQRAVVAACESA